MESFDDTLDEKSILILSPKGRAVSVQLRDHQADGYLFVPMLMKTYGVLLKETRSKPLTADKWVFKTPENKTRPQYQSPF